MLSRVRQLFGGTRGGSNYPYVTARVRALKTDLLPREEYPKLIARDVNAIARSLGEGRYKEEIDELASRYAGAVLVERATRVNMGREFKRIHGWCNGEPAALIGHYLERYTVYNIKTLLRGANAGASREEIEASLIPAGIVPMSEWQAALNAGSVAECIELLPQTDYIRIVREMEDEPLRAIENALDTAYYEHLLGAVDPSDRAKKALLDFLKDEVDVTNLKIVLRSKHADVTGYELVPGGNEITEDRARRLQSATWDEVAAILDETSFGDAMRPAIQTYQETGDLNALVSAIEQFHVRAAEGFSHLYPLSILPIVDYVLRKEMEVDNLRMITFGKQAGLERSEIESLITTL